MSGLVKRQEKADIIAEQLEALPFTKVFESCIHKFGFFFNLISTNARFSIL